jgi:Flp pilus assembly protein TadG
MVALTRVLRRFARAESGAEVIEFGLTLPLMLLVVLGIIEYGFVFQQYEVVTNAAREGARIAVLPNYATTTAAAQTNVTARVDEYLTSAGLSTAAADRRVCGGNITAVKPCTGDWAFVKDTLSPGVCVNSFPVRVEYQHPVPFISGIASYFGRNFGTMTLSAVARMRSEAGATGC